MREEIFIVIPMPPKCLSPNHPPVTMRGVMHKANAKRKQKQAVKEAIEAEQIETLPWEHCTVGLTFFCKTKRGRDSDNYGGSFKSGYDGIVAAGVVKDDTKQFMKREEAVFEIDKENPRVEVLIVRTERHLV